MTSTEPVVIEVIRLLKFSIWPLLLLIALLLFHSPLTRVLDRMQNFEFKHSATETTLKAALELDRAERGRNAENAPSTDEVIATVGNASSMLNRRTNRDPIKALWVDDTPDNNAQERDALSALGFVFTLVKSTQEAKAILAGSNYDLIISDFRRDADPEAGYGLLDYVKTLKDPPPYVIYAASATSELVQQAISRGAFGETNRPSELVRLAVRAISKR
jgi:CheY-like chemotaxis protein